MKRQQQSQAVRRNLILACLLGGLALSSGAFGAGTPAGTAIRHSMVVTYKDANGNPLPSIRSNELVTIVAQVAGVDVSPESVRERVAAGGRAVFAVRVTNIGNGPDELDLAQAGLPGEWTSELYRDLDEDGILDAGEDADPVASVQLAADEEAALLLVAGAPEDGADGDEVGIQLTATSRFDAEATDAGSYVARVARAVIKIAMTATPPDPHPGEEVTFAVLVQNLGSEAATQLQVRAVLPTGLTYLEGSLRFAQSKDASYDGAAILSDAGGDDQGDFGATSAGAVTVALGELGATDERLVFYQTRTDEGLPYGTRIDNRATALFDGPVLTGETAESPLIAVEIAPIADPRIEARVTAGSGAPGDTLWFPLVATNGGNIADLLALEPSSDRGFDHLLWLDANQDGIPGNDGDFELTDSDGDGAIDTRLMEPDATAPLLLGVLITPGTADGEQAVSTLRVLSALDPEATDQASVTVTVTSPNLQVERSVSPEGSQPPGQELTYTVTVTNVGQGLATETTVRGPIPTYTTYVADSVTVDGQARSDNDDADGVTVGHREVVVKLGPLGSGGSRTVQFKVTID